MGTMLDYLDHTMYLSQKALGHGPYGHMVWIYDRPVDLDGLRRFQLALSHGMLGRRVEPSPLPFGRPRWVRWPGPPEVEVAAHARPRGEVIDWLGEQASVLLDPVEGPPWRLSVLPITGGGSAVSLVVSHTIADGVGMFNAIADAVKGVKRDFGYPAPGSRTAGQALREDLRESARAVPEIARAIAAIPKAARDAGSWGQTSRRPRGRRTGQPVNRLLVIAHVDGGQWDERAAALGGSSNSLAMGVTARLVAALGWAAQDGSVVLTLPVNERAADDDRGNAINGVALTVDSGLVTADLGPVRAGLKAALSRLENTPNALGEPLALIRLTPQFLARQVEVRAQRNPIVNSSNMGDVDPAVNRPDGTEADLFAAGGGWNRLECRGRPIEKAGGLLFPVVSGRLGGKVFLDVCYASPDPAFTGQRLRGMVQQSLADFGLSATML